MAGLLILENFTKKIVKEKIPIKKYNHFNELTNSTTNWVSWC